MSIDQRTIALVAEQLGIAAANISRDTRFAEDLGADSLDITEVVIEVETEFNISISDEQVQKFATVGQVIDYVQAHAK